MRLWLAFLIALSSLTVLALTPSVPENWGLSGVDALQAQPLQGKNKVIVAVIDTGVDYRHPDFRDHLWHDPQNPSQFGWDFVADRPNPNDLHGHGSHVSGIIEALNPNVLIMPVKYYSDANPGTVNLKNSIRAMNYAIDHGAQIINYSSGGPEFSEDEYLAIKLAESCGILIVAAAGNGHLNTDLPQNHYFPGDYHEPNIITVASLDVHGNLLTTSNYGKKSVDLAAPGENIYSDLPGGRHGYMSGTSQATAFVTGIASLVLSQAPKMTPSQVREAIMRSVDLEPQLRSKTVSGGRANAYKTLRYVIDHPKP